MPRITFQVDKDKYQKLRSERGLTQEALAKKSRVSKRTIEKFEAGGIVGANSAKCVAEALGVNCEDFGHFVGANVSTPSNPPDKSTNRPNAPRIFISATTSDLGEFRRAVAELLREIGVEPVIQDEFSTDYRTVKEKLRKEILSCKAVICVVGFYYGAEPNNRPDGEPRRSYTQLEFAMAVDLHKPVFVFLAAEDCLDGSHDAPKCLLRSPDEEELRLQNNHREALKKRDELWREFHSKDELLKQIQQIHYSDIGSSHAASNASAERAERLRETKSSLAKILKEATVACDAMSNDLKLNNAHNEPHKHAQCVAEKLVDLPLADFLRCMNRCHQQLSKRTQGKSNPDVTIIEQVTCLLAPFIFDPQIVNSVQTRLGDSNAVVFTLPAATHTLAELILAGAEDHPAEFRTPPTDVDFPEGMRTLEWPPECGIDESGELFAKAWTDQLAEQFVAQKKRSEYANNDEALYKFIERELRNRKADYKKTYYVIFEPSHNHAVNRHWKNAIEQIKQKIPSLTFNQLTEVNIDTLCDEEDLVRPLRDMLWRAAQ